MAFNFNIVQQNNTTNPFEKSDSRLSGVTAPKVAAPVAAASTANAPISDNFSADNNVFKGFKPANDARFVA